MALANTRPQHHHRRVWVRDWILGGEEEAWLLGIGSSDQIHRHMYRDDSAVWTATRFRSPAAIPACSLASRVRPESFVMASCNPPPPVNVRNFIPVVRHHLLHSG